MSFTLREFRTSDEPLVLELLSLSLGWMPDRHHAAFFLWKHRQNPFGISPAWVAVDKGGGLIGFRTFLRWEFEQGGRTVRAARAVDTATHPNHRGAGVFSALTRHAVDQLAMEGVEFIFNTPNDHSRPGYLKMGWIEVGRPRLMLRPGSVTALPRLVRARTAAELWSLPTDAGTPASEVLSDRLVIERLLESQPRSMLMRTRRDHPYLSWRYAGFTPLEYRAALIRGSLKGGLALFRLRRRGSAVEATIGDILAPNGDSDQTADLARHVLQVSGADYAVCTGSRAQRGFLPLPKQGPVVTWKGFGAASVPPSIRTWNLSLGDIELF